MLGRGGERGVETENALEVPPWTTQGEPQAAGGDGCESCLKNQQALDVRVEELDSLTGLDKPQRYLLAADPFNSMQLPFFGPIRSRPVGEQDTRLSLIHI